MNEGKEGENKERVRGSSMKELGVRKAGHRKRRKKKPPMTLFFASGNRFDMDSRRNEQISRRPLRKEIDEGHTKKEGREQSKERKDTRGVKQ